MLNKRIEFQKKSMIISI